MTEDGFHVSKEQACHFQVENPYALLESQEEKPWPPKGPRKGY